MHDIAPLTLADTSWDNVGLLLEAPSPRTSSGVHLCIDLTTSVCQEALSNPDISAILCYHPIIFRGLKSLTLANSQQASLLKLAANGISIYSPHTSLDATTDGINDWIANGCVGEEGFKSEPTPCQKSRNPPKGFEEAGMGRTFTLANGGVTASTLVERLKRHLKIDHLQIALPFKSTMDSEIESIAVCAGSGGSVLSGSDTDCWVTGEMSHVSRDSWTSLLPSMHSLTSASFFPQHEVLAANAVGRIVILTNHTNTERGYLSDILKPRLEELSEGKLKVTVSQSDRDPLQVV